MSQHEGEVYTTWPCSAYTLERSVTKILQLNMKCGNQNMVKHSTHTNKWATRIMPHWIQGNNQSHTFIQSTAKSYMKTGPPTVQCASVRTHS